jgi:hypothetical protein
VPQGSIMSECWISSNTFSTSMVMIQSVMDWKFALPRNTYVGS